MPDSEGRKTQRSVTDLDLERTRKVLRTRKAKILLALALILGVGPFIIPIPDPKGLVPPRDLAEPHSMFAEVGGLLVHYRLQGEEGSPLVLLHGFGASLFSWRGAIPVLSINHTVMAFDRPGFGLTERPRRGEWGESNPYGPEAQAELTFAMMDHAGIDRAVLVGHSAGGTIALLCALTRPERVAALILVAPAVYDNGGPALLRTLMRIPQVRRLSPLLLRSIRSWGIRLLADSWHNASKITPEIIEGYQKPLKAQNWDRALSELILASTKVDLAGRLHEVRKPVLVVTGDDDRIVPTEQSVRLAEDLSGAKLVVIHQCGHLPQEECPEAFLRATIEFLDAI